MKYTYLLCYFLVFHSCRGQQKTVDKEDSINKSDSVPNKVVQKLSNLKSGIHCGFSDSKGNLWFGTNGDGVYIYNGNSFKHITDKDGLSNNEVGAITEDNQGNIWIGTANGVNKYDGDQFTTLAIPQSDTTGVWLDKVYPIVNPNKVMAILQDSSGNFWFGTNGAGVYKYNGAKFTQYLADVGKVYEDGLQHNIVLRIIEDRKHNIWFSSLSHAGVSKFDGTTFTHYVDELSDDFVRTIFEDSKGTIWIGTHGNRQGGLDRFDGKNFTSFHKNDDGLVNNNCRWISEDTNGNLWIGSGIGNLSIFDGEHFKVFQAHDGTTYESISCIINDKKGNVWFGGKYGLWVVEK